MIGNQPVTGNVIYIYIYHRTFGAPSLGGTASLCKLRKRSKALGHQSGQPHFDDLWLTNRDRELLEHALFLRALSDAAIFSMFNM